MSNRPIRNGSSPKFLDRDYRYLLLTVILAVSVFLLFGNPNQYGVVAPTVPPVQAAYAPLQSPALKLLNPQTAGPRKTLVNDASDISDFTLLPAANNPETNSSKPIDKSRVIQNSTLIDELETAQNSPLENALEAVPNRQPTGVPAAAPTNQSDSAQSMVQATTLQKPSARDINAQWQRYVVRKGDTLSRIFRRLRLPQALALTLSRKRPGSLLQRLHPGRILYWKTAADQTLAAMSYAFSTENTLEIRQSATGYQARISPKPVQIIQRQARGKIISSLSQATQQQRVPVSVMLQLVDIFGWDIDFGQDLRHNDSFNVLWQQERWQGKVVRNGPVLAAEFVNQGTRYRAVRFTDSQHKTGYYSPDGSSLRRSFLRTPVKFSRISSGFSLRRYHPKLKKWRAHNGVDYAAPRGTSVRSTADGTVLFKGWKGGYGRTVIIRHGGPYSTVYAHLSKFSRGLRSGSRVKQGDIVAYVGSSGLATGPHLHYEFRVNGKHKNPVTFRPPRALAIPTQELLAFRNSTRQYLAKLEAEQQNRIVANR